MDLTTPEISLSSMVILIQAPWRNHHDATICRQASNAIRAADTEALNWRQARRVGGDPKSGQAEKTAQQKGKVGEDDADVGRFFG